MKKFLSVFLSVLMLLSVFAVFAAADDAETPAEETASYVVTFVDSNGTVLATQTVEAGKSPKAPAEPQPYSDASGKIYEFHAWICSLDGQSYSPFDLPAATADTVYTAEYYVTYEPGEQSAVTFFSFLQGIFQNLTKIFAAATNNVKTWTQHLSLGSEFFKALFENVI